MIYTTLTEIIALGVMEHKLILKDFIDIPANELSEDSIAEIIKNSLTDLYVGNIVSNSYVLKLQNIKYSQPSFSLTDQTKYTVAYRIEMLAQRFYVGEVLGFCRIDTVKGKLLKAAFRTNDGAEVEIITLSRNSANIRAGESDTPLIITGIRPRRISKQLTAVAEVFTMQMALDFSAALWYPHTLSHFNIVPADIDLVDFGNLTDKEKGQIVATVRNRRPEVETNRSTTKSIRGGAKKKDALGEFYYQFDTPANRKRELHHHLLSRIVGNEISITPTKEATAFKAFVRRIKHNIKVVKNARQKIVFTTAKAIENDIAGMYGVDIAVIDDEISNIPLSVEYLDIYKPICSPKYYTLILTTGFVQSRDYCMELINADLARRETINMIFASKQIPANLKRAAIKKYKGTFK